GLIVDDNALAEGVDALIRADVEEPFLHDGLKGGGVGIPERGAADDDVVATAARDRVGAGAADEDVATRAPDQNIRIGVADDRVVALVAVDVLDVVDGAAEGGGGAEPHVDAHIADVSGVIERVGAAAAVQSAGEAAAGPEREQVVGRAAAQTLNGSET